MIENITIPDRLEDTELEKKIPPSVPDAKTFYLGGLFIFALLTTLHVAASIVMPAVLAFMLKLVLQPLMRGFERLHMPRMLASFFIIVILLGGVVSAATALSVPAAKWAEDFPKDLPRLKEKLEFIGQPIKPLKKALDNAQELAGPPVPKQTVTVTLPGTSMAEKFFNGTRNFAGSLFETLLLLFFMLSTGDTFLRRLVESLPRFENKKQAVAISNQIESDISGFLVTITIMNLLVGLSTMAIMFLCHMPDPRLWGVTAFFLNYIPVVGPIFVMALLAGVGLITENDVFPALLPVFLYFLVHVAEGEIITPTILARRFTLNPVLVIGGLFFWSWMWGIPGAILSTPILAIAKIICDRVEKLKPYGHLIEG